MKALAFRFGRFGAVGLASNVTLYFVFLGLMAIETAPVVATAIVYVTGTALNYVLHRQITFADKRKAGPGHSSTHGNDPWRFGGAYGAGLIVSLTGMALMGPAIGPELAQIAVVVLSATTIFTVLNLTGFGSRRPTR